MTFRQVIRTLEAQADPESVSGMARYGITAKKAFGLSAPALRSFARRIGKNHDMAQRLWKTGIYDARILASLIEEPAKVTERQMEHWVREFDSWAICDSCCGNTFDKTPFAYEKALQWSGRDEEFIRRAGFALMAMLAVHDKAAEDKRFLAFLHSIQRAATDERNFVKKAVNWALRQIGKRNRSLNRAALLIAKRIRSLESSSARWIAADALRELQSTAVQRRLRKRA